MPPISNSKVSEGSKSNAKTNTGKRRYKKAVNAEEALNKRKEYVWEFRKFKREENLLKKRRGGVSDKMVNSLTELICSTTICFPL